MKRHWIEYREVPPVCPMTYWVHREVDSQPDTPWRDASEFDPERQAVVPGLGYPVFKVELDGFTFEFASLAEICECIDVLGQKLLPRSIDLSRERGGGHGPNSHWLSRLPANVKPWRYREKAVAYLRRSLADFDQEIN